MRFLVLFSSMLVFAKADAQIVLLDDWLMQAGFNLEFGLDTTYVDTEGNLTSRGADQQWSFNDLEIQETFEIEARPAVEGFAADSFPTADLVLTSELDVGLVASGAEVYLDRDADDLFVVGFNFGDDNPLFSTLTLADKFTFQSAPLTFGNTGNDGGSFRIPFGADLLDSIGIDTSALDLIDSLGVSVGQSLDFTVDSWGTLNIEDNSFDALRVRSVTESSLSLEAKLPFVGWIPLNGLIPGIDSLFPGGGIESTVSYDWLVQEYSYPVVQVAVDEDEAPISVNFALEAATTSTSTPVATPFTIRVAPGALYVDLLPHEEAANAELTILGVDGTALYRGALLGASSTIDTSNWPTGTYLLTLIAGRRLLGTQRVVLGR